MTYNYTNTSPTMTTSMSTAGMTTGTLMPYSTLGTYGNVNSYYTGGNVSVFDTMLQTQETNQTMTSQSMTNSYNNAYQGNVLSATATAQTTEVQKLATDICNLVQNNQLSQFKEKWENFKTAVAQNSIYSQAIDTSNGKQVAAMAESVFQQLTGYSIQEFVKKSSNGSFANGLKAGSTFGIAGSGTSQAEVLAYLSGTEAKTSSQVSECIGGTVGGTLATAAATMAGVGIFDGVAKVFTGNTPISSGKTLGKVGVGAAIAGAVIGLVSSIIKTNQTDDC